MNREATCTLDDCLQATQLIHRLFRALDEKDDALVSGLFAEEGTWHRQGRLLTGPSEVTAALAERAPGRNTIHVISNIQVCSARCSPELRLLPDCLCWH